MEKSETSQYNFVSKHYSKIVFLSILVIICLIYASRAFLSYEQFSPIYLGMFFLLPFSALITSALIVKSKHDFLDKKSFLWLTIALSLWFIAEQLWSVYEYVLNIDPFPSMADIFYIAAYPFFALFLFGYLKPLQKFITKPISIFSIVLSSLFLIPVFVVVYDLNSNSQIIEFLVAISYPIADAILLFPAILGIFFFFKGDRNNFWGSILVGIIMFITADVIFTFLDATNSYKGGNPVDVFWLFGYAFFAYACYGYRKKPLIFDSNIMTKSNLVHPIDYNTIQKLVIPMSIGVILLVIALSIINLSHYAEVENNASPLIGYVTYIVFGIIGVFLTIFIILYKNLERLVTLRTKELEEKQQLIQSQLEQLHKTDRDKTEFLSMITHELKTPLVPIKSYTDLLLSNKLGTLDERQRSRIMIINKSGDTLLKLINDLLDVQKIELGQLKLEPDDVDLKNLIFEVTEKIKPIYSEKSIKLSLRLKDNVIVHVDRVRIEQVLHNLLLNSIDFVLPEIGKIEISLSMDMKNAIVAISDNGVGISTEQLEHLFVKFYQIDTSNTREHGGTGLGLSICRGIIESHGGTIWAKSDGKNHGTTFYFTVPLKE